MKIYLIKTDLIIIFIILRIQYGVSCTFLQIRGWFLLHRCIRGVVDQDKSHQQDIQRGQALGQKAQFNFAQIPADHLQWARGRAGL